MVSDYIVMQCGIRGISSKSISNVHFPVIVASLGMVSQSHRTRRADGLHQSPTIDYKRNIIDFQRAVRERDIRLLLKGFRLTWEKAHPVSKYKKLPYGMDLASRSIGVMRARRWFEPKHSAGLSSHGQVLRDRIFVVCTVGIQCLLRCGEHIEVTLGKASPLDRKHVIFFEESGRAIPYLSVGHVRAHSVVCKVDFSKTDSSGYGRIITHVRQSTRPDLCIVCILENWIVETRDVYGATASQLLYDVPGFPKLRAKEVMRIMRATVKSLNIRGYQHQFCTHSLRYGGAVMMVAAGHPEYLIAIYGGWAPGSRSLHGYIHTLSDESIARVSADMARVAVASTSVSFIRNLHVESVAH